MKTVSSFKEDISKGDLIWGFIGQMQWSSGIVVEVYSPDDNHPDELWRLDQGCAGYRTIYGVLWSNGTFSEHFRHEISLPHEVAKEA